MDTINQAVTGTTLLNVVVIVADVGVTAQDVRDAASSHVPREQSNNPPCTVHAIRYTIYTQCTP